MDTVTDLSELAPRVVCDRAEIDRLRLFQINRYFESGILVQLPNDAGPGPDHRAEHLLWALQPRR